MKQKLKADSAAATQVRAQNEPTYLRPAQLASRWKWHVESVRRLLRDRRLESNIVGRSRLIPFAAVLKLEAEGRITRIA